MAKIGSIHEGCPWVYHIFGRKGPGCNLQAYLENNLGIAKLLLGELNEGALHVAQAARMEPAVPAFAYNVNLLNEMAAPSLQPIIDMGCWEQSGMNVPFLQ